MFWLGAAILAAIGALSVVWPLLRRGGSNLERADGALAIFKDQLKEVDRDAARGLISGPEAEAAKIEIKRRMLAADKDRNEGDGKQGGLALLFVMAFAVPLGGAGIYILTGNPDIPSMPFAERDSEQEAASDLVVLTERLETRLREDPEGGETRGWQLLATTYMNMGRVEDALKAWEILIDREDANSATFSQYAEALITAESGVVGPKARDAIARATALDPANPAATFYNAMALEQDGKTPEARRSLIERIAQESAPQPWMEVFLREANRMGAEFGLDPVGLPDFPDAPRGPSAADVEAAQEMSADDRMEFIRSMVSGLAERLEEDPSDLQGWMQLARAYTVLGENENAIGALTSAKKLTDDLPSDDPRRQAVEQGLSELQN